MDKKPKERIKKGQSVQIAIVVTDEDAEEGQKTEEKKIAFSANQNNGKPKSNRKHGRSKSGGVLLVKSAGVHWEETNSTANGQMEDEIKKRKKNGRTHRRAKSHGTVRPIYHPPADIVTMKGWDKTETDKWTIGTEERRAQNAEKPTILSSAIKTQKNKITVAKRRYSVFRHDSLMWEEMPQFTESDRRLRKSVPSSPQTILVLAGLFVCGLILLISGLIVLLTNWQNANVIQNGWYYHVAGCTMLLLGFSGLGICALLQRKNITKLAEDMSRDLFNVAANAAASEEKRASEEKAMVGGNKKLKRMLAQVPSTMI
ncbi:hypothetical protein niasHT_037525 [Heterodera trifolii]|uniref:Transmembrane protein n=1 Tax=Heterodera trifolii TaxID=157864 RepID=A0ABD2IPL2_9BILA